MRIDVRLGTLFATAEDGQWVSGSPILLEHLRLVGAGDPRPAGEYWPSDPTALLVEGVRRAVPGLDVIRVVASPVATDDAVP